MEEIGRNDPCPCGSGKKYKKCCGVVKMKKIEASQISSVPRSSFFASQFANVAKESQDLKERVKAKKAEKNQEKPKNDL